MSYTLQELLATIGLSVDKEQAQSKIKSITCDSRKAKRSSLFIAIKGPHSDGHKFLEEVWENGCDIALVEEIQENLDITQILTKDSRQAFSQLQAHIHGQPAKSLKLIGVTGTNGKTSISHIINHLYTKLNIKTGLIGTNGIQINGQKQDATHTTPDPESLQKIFVDMKEEKVEACIMEVSSHALKQNRLANSQFEAAIFTNLTQDHLDYHLSMEDYFHSKALLFQKHFKEKAPAIINLDDPYGEKLCSLLKKESKKLITFGLSEKADYQIIIQDKSLSQSSFELKTSTKTHKITTPRIGDCNIANTASALIATHLQTGIPLEEISPLLTDFPGIPGRFQRIVEFDKPNVFIDYAHTPDALEKILKNAKALCSGRLHVIFGCGGDRDQTKRPLMAKATQKHADLIIVTDDNPRTENPDSIRDMITEGFDKATSYVEIEDRDDAILYAIRMMNEEDSLIIAGKGHEDYQIIGTKKETFSDYQHALEALKLYWDS